MQSISTILLFSRITVCYILIRKLRNRTNERNLQYKILHTNCKILSYKKDNLKMIAKNGSDNTAE